MFYCVVIVLNIVIVIVNISFACFVSVILIRVFVICVVLNRIIVEIFVIGFIVSFSSICQFLWLGRVFFISFSRLLRDFHGYWNLIYSFIINFYGNFSIFLLSWQLNLLIDPSFVLWLLIFPYFFYPNLPQALKYF